MGNRWLLAERGIDAGALEGRAAQLAEERGAGLMLALCTGKRCWRSPDDRRHDGG